MPTHYERTYVSNRSIIRALYTLLAGRSASYHVGATHYSRSYLMTFIREYAELLVVRLIRGMSHPFISRSVVQRRRLRPEIRAILREFSQNESSAAASAE